MRKENVVIVVLLVVILALLVWMNLPKSVEVESKVNVTGSAKTTIVKDLVTVTLGVTTQDKTVKDALSKNNADITKIINALKGIGVTEEDIQTSSFWLILLMITTRSLQQGLAIVSNTILRLQLKQPSLVM